MLHDELPIATLALPPAPDRSSRARSAPPEHQLATELFNIRLANSAGRREAASLLIRKMYGWRGYAFDPSEPYQANKLTLYAESAGRVVGTMSLCLDSGAGLPADENFPDKLGLLRGMGRRLCEPSRLAIDRGVSKQVFAAMMHISHLYAQRVGCTDYVIEVNPRHVQFYKRMLGFSDFGGERPCQRVGAPAVLLRLSLARVAELIAEWGGRVEQHGEERSCYPYFFPQSDEAGITARLMAGRR